MENTTSGKRWKTQHQVRDGKHNIREEMENTTSGKIWKTLHQARNGKHNIRQDVENTTSGKRWKTQHQARDGKYDLDKTDHPERNLQCHETDPGMESSREEKIRKNKKTIGSVTEETMKFGITWKEM